MIGGQALRRRDVAVLVEVDAELAEVDVQPISASAGTVPSVAAAFCSAVAEGDEDIAEAVIGERLRFGPRRHRQPNKRQHERPRRLEAVAVERLPEPFDGGEELAGAQRIGHDRVARVGVLQRIDGRGARGDGFGCKQRLGIGLRVGKARPRCGKERSNRRDKGDQRKFHRLRS